MDSNTLGLTRVGWFHPDERSMNIIDIHIIDKSSSAELSESINSMFLWYRKAITCYAYLSDVPFFDDSNVHDWLANSRWFTREWTLQELLAAAQVRFYAVDWKLLGTKLQLCRFISETTGISKDALLARDLSSFTVAERMSWAATRETTRTEDVAYCLLGIFNINMPLLYGEGDQAFRRLQEQIIENTEDYTIFAWQDLSFASRFSKMGLLAKTPSAFGYTASFEACWTCSDLTRGSSSRTMLLRPDRKSVAEFEERFGPPAVTSRGICLYVPTLRRIGEGGTHDIILCAVEPDGKQRRSWLCLRLQPGGDSFSGYCRHGAALRLVDEEDLFDVEIRQFYGSRIDPPATTGMTISRSAVLLGLLVDDLLVANRPLLSPSTVANRLRDNSSWCDACQEYNPTLIVEQCFLCARCESASMNFPQVEKQKEQTLNNTSPDRDVKLRSILANLIDGRHKAQAFNDDSLHRIESCLHELQLEEHVTRPPNRNLVLYSLVAIAQERRMQRLDAPSQLRFLTTFVSLIKCTAPVGCTMLMVADGWMKDNFAHQSVTTATLIASLIQGCQTLSTKNDLDGFSLRVAEGRVKSTVLNQLRRSGLRASTNAEREMLHTVAAYADAETVVDDFISRMQGYPAPTLTDDFVAWLWTLFEAWQTYAKPRDLIIVFQSVCKLFDQVAHVRTQPLFHTADRIARMLLFCAQVQATIEMPLGHIDNLDGIEWKTYEHKWTTVRSALHVKIELEAGQAHSATHRS